MVTPEEFKDLTDSLSDIGAYEPSVGDFLLHLSKSDLMRLDPENPHVWQGFIRFSTTSTDVEETSLDHGPPPSACRRPVQWGKYSSALREILSGNKLLDHKVKASTFGLEIEMEGEASFHFTAVISLSPEEFMKNLKAYQDILRKTNPPQ